jgi:hypothetical protein
MVISRVYIVKYILFFTFLANAFLGYPYSNITIWTLPLNEWLLLVSLILIVPSIPNIVKTYPILIPILLWSVGYLTLSVPVGFSEYGIWAGRDALHLIEVWWLLVILFVLSRVDIRSEFTKATRVLFFLIMAKIVLLLFGDIVTGVLVIQGVQGEVDLLGSKIGSTVILFLVFWLWFVKLDRGMLIPIMLVFFFVILQFRYIYIAILASILLHLTFSKNFLFQGFKAFIFLMIFLLVLQLVSMLDFLDEYTKWGIEKISPVYLFSHLLSSFSIVTSDTFLGAASGVYQRLDWLLLNWDRAINNVNVFLFGQGFGPLLTDFSTTNAVREPHNSYLSVFARTGLIGFILWMFFHVYINTKVYLLLLSGKEKIRVTFSFRILLAVFMSMHAMYWFSLVEPGFETPNSTIPFYILLGIMIFFIKKNNRVYYDK